MVKIVAFLCVVELTLKEQPSISTTIHHVKIQNQWTSSYLNLVRLVPGRKEYDTRPSKDRARG
jgi:hypothetical protein